MEELVGFGDDPPVVVADEPDPGKPDEWLIHAYFDYPPTDAQVERLKQLGAAEPLVEQLGEADWVTMSQAGLQPIRAGRFYVHTPMYSAAPPGTTELCARLASPFTSASVMSRRLLP